MAELSFHMPGKVLFGSDVINLLGSIASAHGNRSVLIADHVLHEGRYIEKVLDILRKKNIDSIIVDDLSTSGARRTVSDVASFARASRTQIVIGMGGMRCLSLARKVACFAGPVTKAQENCREPLAYIEIPSVFRNPLLLSDAYLDIDPGTQRPSIVRTSPGMIKAVIVDPSLTVSLSPKYVGTLLLDSILNSIEGYLSMGANFFSDELFLSSLRLLGEAVDAVSRGEKDLRHRVKASQAGLLSAVGFTSSSTGAGTVLSYSVNSLFRTPKSWVGTVLLPHIIDTHLATQSEKLAVVARVLGIDVFGLPTAEAAHHVSQYVRRAIARFGLPARLRDFDLKLNELVGAAEAASTFESTNNLPIPMNVDGLYDLLKRAY